MIQNSCTFTLSIHSSARTYTHRPWKTRTFHTPIYTRRAYLYRLTHLARGDAPGTISSGKIFGQFAESSGRGHTRGIFPRRSRAKRKKKKSARRSYSSPARRTTPGTRRLANSWLIVLALPTRPPPSTCWLAGLLDASFVAFLRIRRDLGRFFGGPFLPRREEKNACTACIERAVYWWCLAADGFSVDGRGGGREVWRVWHGERKSVEVFEEWERVVGRKLFCMEMQLVMDFWWGGGSKETFLLRRFSIFYVKINKWSDVFVLVVQ